MTQRDRKRLGSPRCRAAWLLGITAGEYRALEDGDAENSPDLWQRKVEVFQWPEGRRAPGFFKPSSNGRLAFTEVGR